MIALISYYHKFSQTEPFGFIFPTIVDKLSTKLFSTIVGKSSVNSNIQMRLDPHYEKVDNFGGSASFPATAPPPIGPFQQDYYAGGVVKVKKVRV